MVLCLVVRFEVFVCFFKRFLFDGANKAFALFVLLNLVAFLPQLSESIDQDTTDDIAKKHVHKNSVNHVRNEPTGFERIHVFTDLFVNVKFDDAVEQGLAVIFGYFLRVK